MEFTMRKINLSCVFDLRTMHIKVYNIYNVVRIIFAHGVALGSSNNIDKNE